MAAFLAFIELRKYLIAHPSLSLTDVLSSLRKLRSGAAGLDFPAATVLFKSFDPDLPWDQTKAGLRLFVF